MKNLYTILLLILYSLFPTTSYANPTQLPNINWDLISTLPIQNQGRIQPLDSFARLTLFQISGKTTLTWEGKKFSAVQWLTQVIFQPKMAVEYPIFLVENPEILENIQIKPNRVRGRYSYQDLSSGIPTLEEYCWKLHRKTPENYSMVDRQIFTLYTNIQLFEDLQATFSFLEAIPFKNKEFQEKIGMSLSIWDCLEFLSGRLKEKPDFSQNNQAVQKLAELWLALGDEASKKEFVGIIQSELMQRVHSLPKKDLAIFPDHPTWSSPWKSLARTQDQHASALLLWKDIARAYQTANLPELEKLLKQHHERLNIQIGGLSEYKKIPLEVQYNQHDSFFLSKIVYLLTMLICAMSWWGKSNKIYRTAIVIFVVGFLLESYGLVLRMLIKGRPPVSNLYETMIFVSWFSVAMSLVLEFLYRNRIRSLSLFCGSLIACVLLFMSEKFAYETDTMGVLIAVLDSNFWLATHVTTITIGYSATLIAGGIAHIFVFLPKKLSSYRQDMERMIYGTIAFSTIFTFLGTVLGGFWADQSWGRFWGWDPKENGALVLLLWNSVILHARSARYIREWGVALSAVLGNIIVAGAWWGVNLLNIGLHSYGFSDGVKDRLFYFVLVETIVLCLGCFLLLKSDALKAEKENCPTNI